MEEAGSTSSAESNLKKSYQSVLFFAKIWPLTMPFCDNKYYVNMMKISCQTCLRECYRKHMVELGDLWTFCRNVVGVVVNHAFFCKVWKVKLWNQKNINHTLRSIPI